jgi:hypothetical protein
MCGALQRSAADPTVPITFDPGLNEFHLTCENSAKCLIMSYCFHCGGRLPESRRSELFAHPLTEDENSVRDKLSGVITVQDVIAAIGPPDSEVDIETENARRYLIYTRAWKSVDVTVCEHVDGTISYCWSGKIRGNLG